MSGAAPGQTSPEDVSAPGEARGADVSGAVSPTHDAGHGSEASAGGGLRAHSGGVRPVRRRARLRGVESQEHRSWLALAALWAIVTAYNLFKPFHIDDAAHLEIAKWIAGHPLHGMSGRLNWMGANEPIWATNQPHLYFAVLALWGRLFGFAEPTMHILQSGASLVCILLFHRLARFFAPTVALWATAVVILSPAFIVEQNLMVDVPLLALWLAFFNLIICGGADTWQTRRFVLAGLACAAAILVKYSSLALFPILAFALLIERRKAQAWTLIIPIAAIGAWSLLNYLDYGRVHILARAHDDGAYALRPVFSMISWMVGFGALAPFGLIAAVQFRASWRQAGWLFYAALGVGFALLAGAVAAGVVADSLSDRLLMTLFALNAALAAAAVTPPLFRACRSRFWSAPVALANGPMIYCGLWLVGTTAFYALISPFIAPRHLLLVIPAATLILAAAWGPSLTRASKVFGLLSMIVVSAGLCLSDWRFADFYRAEAARLGAERHGPGVAYASGHWGWQWYAGRSGFPEVDVKNPALKVGDAVLVAREVDHQMLPSGYRLRLVRTDTQDLPLANLVCSGRPARFYAFSYRQAPWSLSRACLNHLDIYRVVQTPRTP